MTKGQTEQEIIHPMIISLATGCALTDSLSVTTVLHIQMDIVLGDSKEVLYVCVCVCGGGGVIRYSLLGAGPVRSPSYQHF